MSTFTTNNGTQLKKAQQTSQFSSSPQLKMDTFNLATPPTSNVKRTMEGSNDFAQTQKRRRSTATPTPKRGLRIAVEGNIATGKSTFLNIVEAKIANAQCVQEPIERWTDIGDDGEEEQTASQQNGGNLLGLFYKEPKRWAYTFQTYAFLSRLKAQMNAFKDHASQKQRDLDDEAVTPTKSGNDREAQPRSVHILERSIYSDRLCFAAHCNASGLLSDMEYNIYTDFHTFVAENFEHLQLDGIIYLRSDPKVCNDRLHKRARPEEDALPLSYLEAVHERHEDWLIHKRTNSPGLAGKNVPILVLDCNNDFQDNLETQAALLKQTEEFVGMVGKTLDEKEGGTNSMDYTVE